LQSEFLELMEEKMQKVISNVIMEIENSENDSKLFNDSSDVYENRK